MKWIRSCKWMLLAGLLLGPSTALADFAFSDFGQYAQDQGPTWLAQILAAIFVLLSESLFVLLGFGTTA